LAIISLAVMCTSEYTRQYLFFVLRRLLERSTSWKNESHGNARLCLRLVNSDISLWVWIKNTQHIIKYIYKQKNMRAKIRSIFTYQHQANTNCIHIHPPWNSATSTLQFRRESWWKIPVNFFWLTNIEIRLSLT
jgi:hypothetical protein